MSCKWNSLGKQECLNEASFLFYAGCTEGCLPPVFSSPLTDTAILLTSLCLVEKSSHILSFLFGFPRDSMNFYITGNCEMAAKTRHHVGKCIADNFQCSCLLQSYKLLCWTTQRQGFGKSRLQGACTLSECNPPTCCQQLLSKYNAKPVIAKYRVLLGLYVGFVGLCTY